MYLIHTLNNARIQCQILIDCYLFHQPYSGQEQDEKKKIGLMKPLHETNYYILIYMIDFDWIKLFM
jgi:hypothetical protein